MEEMISISKQRYEVLLKAEEELKTLYAFGVDTWECYSEAMESLSEE